MDDPQQASPTSERIWQWVRRRPLPAMGAALLAVVGLVLLYWAFLPYRAPADIGFVYYDADTGRLLHRTLWDWLGLLIIPAVLAVAVYWLNRSQKATELKIAEKARETERRIADSRQKQATLEAYYDRMTELLLEHKLRESPPDSEARSIARALTITVVKSLDGARNEQLFGFLKASRLMEEEAPVIDPEDIDFSGADMGTANLSGANLSGSNLTKANLSGANLSGANLSGARLIEARLTGAFLPIANLSRASLLRADLSKANMEVANLHGTYLKGANLSEALLMSANLSWATLNEANLSRAELFNADLSKAKEWTVDQFDAASPLESVTMPDGVMLKSVFYDGPTYDEWKAQYQAKQAQPGT